LKKRTFGVAARAATLTLRAARPAAGALLSATLFGCGAATRAPATPDAAPAAPAQASGGAISTAPAASPEPAASELAATRVDPRKVPVPSADAPSRGPLDAPVTVQVFSDFECPFCAMAAPVVRELESEFGGSIRVVWRNLPLPMHPHAGLAAVTGLEVYAERGGAAFWRFHDSTFAAQRGGLDAKTLEKLAVDAGVDPERYHEALEKHVHDAKVQADLDAGDAAGINGTPAFFINSYFAVGALPYPEMRAIVVQALRETKR
jgi:protein-disulfide isomerase